MSIIEGVDGPSSITVSDVPSTVADVAERGRRSIRELIDDQVLDELLARSRDEAGGLRLTGEGSKLVKTVLKRALEAELSSHLGYAKHDFDGYGSGNSCNRKIHKTCRPKSDRYGWRYHATGRAASIRCWFPSGRAGYRTA